MHGAEYIRFRRLTHGVLLIVRQNDHILPCVPKVAIQVGRHVLDVVDAASQLSSLPKVVDPYQQCLPPPGAVGVLKAVALWSAGAKALHALWRRWRSVKVTVNIGIGIDRGQTFE